MQYPHFIDADGSFTPDRPEEISQLYFPLASEAGLKSCVSPDLGGDAKLDQETFLLEPVSVENLHNNRSTRNFWLVGADGAALSLTGASASQQAVKFSPAQDDSRLTAGFMWHTLERTLRPAGVRATLTSFVPVRDNVEVLSVTVENLSDRTLTFTPYGAVPPLWPPDRNRRARLRGPVDGPGPPPDQPAGNHCFPGKRCAAGGVGR